MSLSMSSHTSEHNLTDKGETKMTGFEPVKKKILNAVEEEATQLKLATFFSGCLFFDNCGIINI